MSNKYRSNFNPMMFHKNVKHSGKPKHEANQFIYDKFLSMRESAGQKNNTGSYHCYGKILKTLEKYPMPVLNAKQALDLEGVGPKTAAIIANLITKHYANKIEDPSPIVELNLSQENEIFDEPLPADELLEDYNQHSQDVDLRSRIQQIEKFIQDSPAKVVRKSESPQNKSAPDVSVKVLDLKKRSRHDVSSEEDDEDFSMIMKKYFSLKKPKEEEKKEDEKSEASDDLDFMINTSSQEKKPLDTEFKLFSLKKEPETKTQSKKKRNYRPDADSSGGFILLGLKNFEEETGKKYATKKEIKEHLKNITDLLGPMEIKSWAAIETLSKNDMIVSFNFNNEMKYSLSLTGKEIADDLTTEKLAQKKSSNNSSKPNSNDTSNSFPLSLVDNEVPFIDKTNLPIKTPKITKSTSFESEAMNMSQSSQPTKPIRFYSQDNVQIKGLCERAVNFSQMDDIPEENNSQGYSQSMGFMSQSLSRREKVLDSYEQKASGGEHYVHKVKKNTITKIDVTLYVDNREVKNKVERTFIFNKLSEAGANCKLMNLPLGDFLWVVDIQGSACNQTYTLDYVVERKTADDLASSILDNRYAQQKFRLKNSKIKNVFYLVEGKPTQSATIKESALDTAMLHTQILNGLKVRTTVNLQESIKWLILMNNSIESKILQEMKKDDKDYLEFQYTYDEYQVITAKNNMNMKILFGNMMRQVKGLGRETISEFLEKFDSFNDFYSYFTKIQGNEDKLSFLGQKEKKSKKKKGIEAEFHDPKELKVNKTVASYIMTLFNADAYPKVLSKDSIKFHEDTTL